MKKNHVTLLGALVLSFAVLFKPPCLQADEKTVRMKILAVNPSATEPLKAPVSQVLPAEIKPDDVIDSGGMEVKYDPEKKSYYLTKEVELGPREVREIAVVVKNVWVVPEELVAEIKVELEHKNRALKGTNYEGTSQLLYEKISERLGVMEEEAKKPLGIRRRIELYRAHIAELESVRSDVMSLEALRRLKDEQEQGPRTAKFVIKAENPANEPRQMTVRANLPEAIKAEDVLDAKGFTLLFDKTKRLFAIVKEDPFNAQEQKSYEIILRDIWYIPDKDLEFLKAQTEKMVPLFKGSPYEKFAEEHGAFILDSIKATLASQEEALGLPLQERIRAFELNNQRMRLSRKKYQELQDLLTELPLKTREDALEKVKAAMRQLQKVSDLSKILSMGFQPDLATTWWIILGIVAFLAVLSLIFYFTWLGRLKQYVYEKKVEEEARKTGGKAA